MKSVIATLIILLFLSACSVSKNLHIKSLSEREIADFYQINDVEEFFILKEYNSLVKLSEQSLITIPTILIFNEENKQIKYFDEKNCGDQAIEFLENYNLVKNQHDFDYGDINLDEYLGNFTKINDSINRSQIKKSNNLKVFMNTASYAENKNFNSNREAFEVYKRFKNQFDIYIINLDLNQKWDE